ncbi:MAG: T9SS type A sorting domain-containing protein [Bacteroidetes bacterium]|nr:T9SS type A sorting domain-containing protein [Bacteroidota bacterium]
MEVDTGGTMVRQWLDPNDSTYGAYGLTETKDGGFIYAAQKKVYEFFPFIYSTATVVKMNSSFNKEWTYRGGGATEYTGQFGWILRLDSNGCEVENCLVGVDEVVKPEINGIKVYPNPASTEITVDYSLFDWIQQEEISLVLMNSLGQSIYQASVPQYSWLQRIDISSYPVGLYVCYIKRNVTIIATSKFAKQ